ncbi:MAG: SDR family oxidoreductase [Acidobacteria bacterium]|nr:SDR family oxidoreductase [Acidobacteriota bacterium]
MNHKVVMITGATSGIGKAAAEELARRGATVIVVGRNRQRAESTAAAIQERVANAAVEWMAADFTSLEQVRRLAEEFRARHNQLHVLLNNAGLWWRRRQVTTDGFEATFAVNHLAHFLLTNLLLDTLKASAPARVVNVSSGAHRRGRIDFQDLMAEKRYNGLRCYSNSKLANILFTQELARRLQGSGVTANSLHPGLVATGLFTNVGSGLGLLLQLIRPWMLRPEQGARTCVYAASAPELENVSGRYFDNCRENIPAPEAQDEAAARRLWQVSAEMTGLQEKARDAKQPAGSNAAGMWKGSGA